MSIPSLPTFLGMVSGDPATPLPPDLRVGDLLARAAENPDGALIVPDGDGERRIAFGDLLADAQAIAGALAARGVGPGARVGLLQPNSPELLASFFGVTLTGAAAVVLPPPLPFGRTESTVRQLSRIAAAAKLAATIVPAYLRDIAVASNLTPVCTVDELTAEHAPFVPVAVDAEAPAIIQFTSGSTSLPRGAMISHRAVLAQIRAVVDRTAIGADDCGCIWLPLYHDFGLITSLIFFFTRTPVVLMRPEEFIARPLRWLEVVSRYRVTHAPAPHFAYSLCAARLAREPKPGLDLSSWRVAWNGGEPIEARTLDRTCDILGAYGFARTTMSPSYGLAEATLALTTPRPGREPNAVVVDQAALGSGRVEIVPAGTPGSIRLIANGPPLPGVTVAVVGPAGRDVGDIWAGGPTLMSGYLDAPIETARTLQGRWLVTGDLGFIHDGELYVCGRKKDVIIIRGRNFYPQDIEAVMNPLPEVRRGTSVATSRRGDDGEEVIVFVETKLTDQEALAALAGRIDAAIRAEIGITPALVALLAPGALPKTSSGKLQRRYTATLLEAGDLEMLLARGPATVSRRAA